MNSNDIAARRRALFDRIISLDNASLTLLEGQIDMLEKAPPQPAPGVPRTVLGATVTDRPDLIAASGGTLINATGGTVQAPERDHPAELAKVGAERR